MDKKGFSLVEVIITITLIAVIGVASSTVLTRTYRAGSQADSYSRLKKNGDLAVSSMMDIIRTSEGVVCYGNPVAPNSTRKTEIVVRTLLGKFIKFSFIDPYPASGSPSQNGYIVKQEGLDPSLTQFCDTVLASPTGILITNNNSVSGVSISNGQFNKLTDTVSKDAVEISFYVNRSLRPAQPSIYSETVKIETTVQVR